MTALRQIFAQQIATSGPIPLAQYMAQCLLHPEHGYYTSRDPFGHKGDFITAPEISQMFGEMIGLALAQAWLDQGAPASFSLVELGPGRGTLIKDILRATKAVHGFHDAAQLHLVERSPVLRNSQAETLAPMAVTHHDDVDSLPEAPIFMVANEFFDALPIEQYERAAAGWCQRQIGFQDDTLIFGNSAPLPVSDLDHRLEDTKDGDIVELCPAARMIMAQIAQRIQTYGGAAFVIDYGDWRSQGDTLQAMQAHKYVDPLANPGDADLTAHVDFETLAQAADGLAHSLLTPQGVFLERLGITARAQSLAKSFNAATLESHIKAHRRLTHPDEMGNLFKVMGFTQIDAPDLAGLQKPATPENMTYGDTT